MSLTIPVSVSYDSDRTISARELLEEVEGRPERLLACSPSRRPWCGSFPALEIRR